MLKIYQVLVILTIVCWELFFMYSYKKELSESYSKKVAICTLGTITIMNCGSLYLARMLRNPGFCFLSILSITVSAILIVFVAKRKVKKLQW